MISNDMGTCGWLVDELVAARLVERDVLDPYLADFTAESPYADADAFAKHLARAGLISRYQAKRAVDGDARKLVLGSYLLVDIVGSGSLGPVYAAKGRADGKRYAVKVLPQRAWNVRLARKQVRLFEELTSKEGLVPFVDVGTAHGLHYLVWPFIEGRTLATIIPSCGPLPPSEVAGVGIQIARTLRLCQSRGLVHGLIKPSNVLITSDGQARLLDFGIGALLAENSDEESLVDTVSRAGSLAQILECCSPECVADSSKWLPAGDQYSLGCTLYYSATGRYPFPGGAFIDKIIAHQTKKPTAIRSLNPDVPPELANIIDRLLQKLPNNRYGKLDDLIFDLGPVATASRIILPHPVNVETPAPVGRLVIGTPKEPATVSLPKSRPKAGFFGRVFGTGASAREKLHATVVGLGPYAPGATATIHVYVHDAADSRPLADALRALHEQPRIAGTCQSRREIAQGSRVGLHLDVAGAAVSAPLQEFDRAHEAQLFRFTVSIPSDAPLQPLRGRLMVGQEGRLIAEVEFAIPVALAIS